MLIMLLDKIKKHVLKALVNFKVKNIAQWRKIAKICGLKETNIYRSINKIKEVSGRLDFTKKISK